MLSSRIIIACASVSAGALKGLPKMSTAKIMKPRQSGYETIQVPSSGLLPDVVVDLRSDTVTSPSKGMREAMAKADVGDDVMGEDPTVKELERRVASMLGKQAGLFVTSGTMGNLLAELVHCNERGSEVIVGDKAHMFFYEQGNAAVFGGIHSYQIPNKVDGTFEISGVVERIRADDIHFPRTKLIAVENTHNRMGGKILPLEWIDELSEVAKTFKIPLHMDGARLFNAAVGTGIDASRIVRDIDSISVCFSKGLGAPVGSVLVGDKEFIEKARRIRKGLGGGMRQLGILGAAGLYCLDHMIDRLKNDHDNARIIATTINKLNSPNVFVDIKEVETNIMFLNVQGIDIDEFCKRLMMVEENERDTLGSLVSVKCVPASESIIRVVTHADVSCDMAIKAAEKICLVTKEFVEKAK